MKNRELLVYAAASVLVAASAVVLMFLGNKQEWPFAAGVLAGMGLIILYAVATSLFAKPAEEEESEEEPTPEV